MTEIPMVDNRMVYRPCAVRDGPPVCAMVFIPRFNNPAGEVWPEADKRAVVSMADRAGATIIEDHIDGDAYFGDIRPWPRRAFSDRVILRSNDAKTISPDICLG
ncbi:hypothetical protein FJU30_24695 [Affinibrenneria salicis]|uniref:Uncharacterized protein n=1 Tax=Affinibrenneria salicis TaxID=2590031 RepID=A0A5J5FQP6_9GAMM|nr:hypothetical protein [Affinibrenneria salicis]KAA8995389.1 hypothetical protein FJU30_24695 [Affinibrenneria salicis]